MSGPIVGGGFAGKRRLTGVAGALLLASLAAGCAASPPQETALAANDPAEPVNRAVFDANMAVDKAVVKPAVEAYRDNVPAPVRTGIANAATNLNEPFVAANDVLQGNFTRALTATERFAINTTAGLGGFVDRAKDLNLPGHTTDIGQTLATWGVGEGPAVQLPALGPSNLRDSVGTVAGFVLNPLSFTGYGKITEAGYARGGADFVDTRTSHLTDLEQLERTSMDLYATLRSVQRQHRQAEIDKAKAGTP